MDYLLCFQARCYSITNVLVFAAAETPTEQDAQKPVSSTLITALSNQLTDLWRGLPAQIRLDSEYFDTIALRDEGPLTDNTDITQMYYYGAELTVRETLLHHPPITSNPPDQIQRLQDLDAILTAIERHVSIGLGMRPADWYGMDVEMFAQFTHCLVVLFKLTSLSEPGWDVEQVKKRADLFSIIDHFAGAVEAVVKEVGLIDAPGPRRGVFFQAPQLLMAIKALFMIEMGQEDALPMSVEVPALQEGDHDESLVMPLTDEFLWALADEPWLSDMFGGAGDEFGIFGESG